MCTSCAVSDPMDRDDHERDLQAIYYLYDYARSMRLVHDSTIRCLAECRKRNKRNGH